MDILRDAIMLIGLPREYHNTLSKWAAERNLRNPDNKVTAEIMAVEAICEYVDRIEQIETNLGPKDKNVGVNLFSPGCDSADSLE